MPFFHKDIKRLLMKKTKHPYKGTSCYALMCLTLLLFFCFPLMAQTISGTIYDDKGARLPKFTINVKGTSTNTLSGDDGAYTISIVPGNDFTLQAGDVVKISIDNIGELINTVA